MTKGYQNSDKGFKFSVDPEFRISSWLMKIYMKNSVHRALVWILRLLGDFLEFSATSLRGHIWKLTLVRPDKFITYQAYLIRLQHHSRQRADYRANQGQKSTSVRIDQLLMEYTVTGKGARDAPFSVKCKKNNSLKILSYSKTGWQSGLVSFLSSDQCMFLTWAHSTMFKFSLLAHLLQMLLGSKMKYHINSNFCPDHQDGRWIIKALNANQY